MHPTGTNPALLEIVESLSEINIADKSRCLQCFSVAHSSCILTSLEGGCHQLEGSGHVANILPGG